jgi:hypothetical protein
MLTHGPACGTPPAESRLWSLPAASLGLDLCYRIPDSIKPMRRNGVVAGATASTSDDYPHPQNCGLVRIARRAW